MDRTRVAGGVATVVAVGGILLAIALDPTFSWTGDALSALGVRERSALAFNGGLVLGGVVGVAYAVGCWTAATTRLARLVAVAVGLSLASMAGVGVFDLTHDLHAPVAVGVYLFATVAFALDGIDRRDEPTGRVALALVPIHVVAWATWVAGYWPGAGLALPELFGALCLAAWVWVVGPRPVVEVRRWGGRG